MRRHEKMIADVIATRPHQSERLLLGTLFVGPLSRENKRFDMDAFMRHSRVRAS